MNGLLTLSTSAGIVDLVAVRRVVTGKADGDTLTDGERRYLAHALLARGVHVSRIADVIHANNDTTRALLAAPYPHPIDPLDVVA